MSDNREALVYLAKRWGECHGLVYDQGRNGRPQGVYASSSAGEYKYQPSWARVYGDNSRIITEWIGRIMAGAPSAAEAVRALKGRAFDDLPGAAVCMGFSRYNEELRAVAGLEQPRGAPDLGVIGAMLGERALGADRSGWASQQYLLQPARLKQERWASFGGLGVKLPAGRTVLLQWTFPHLDLVNVWAYSPGVGFYALRFGSPIGKWGAPMTEADFQALAFVGELVEGAEAFCFELPKERPPSWPVRLPFMRAHAAPDVLLEAMDRCGVAMVDSGFSGEFLLSHDPRP